MNFKKPNEKAYLFARLDMSDPLCPMVQEFRIMSDRNPTTDSKTIYALITEYESTSAANFGECAEEMERWLSHYYFFSGVPPYLGISKEAGYYDQYLKWANVAKALRVALKS